MPTRCDLIPDSPILVTLIPYLKTAGDGHDYVYNRCVQKAAEKLGWGYIAAVPAVFEADINNPQWRRCLANPDWMTSRGPIGLIAGLLLSVLAMSRLLRRFKSTRPKILFIESFDPITLAAMTAALVLTGSGVWSVWLLYRRDDRCNGLKGAFYRLANRLLEQMVNRQRFRLLTDSERLARWFGDFFHRRFTVMPIPHTAFLPNSVPPATGPEIVCWLAGQQLNKRHSFNLRAVRHLISRTHQNAHQIRLVMSDSVSLVPPPDGIRLQTVPSILSAMDYEDLLFTADLTLLPYDPATFSRRTSGVFVECLMAGGTPVVSAGTWMAYELERYNLSELIVDWHGYDLIERLIEIHGNQTIKGKLKAMQRAYGDFHNIDNYAYHMQSLHPFRTSLSHDHQ